MTDTQTPPPSDAEPSLVHAGWWCWRGDNHGHLATTACRSDNVPIHVPAEWADEMRAVIRRIEDGDDDEESAAGGVVSAAPDQADLRARIAEALDTLQGTSHHLPTATRQRVEETVTGVLATVLRPPADRAAVYRDLIAKAEEWDGHITVQELRRLAAEAQQPSGPDACSGCRYVPCGNCGTAEAQQQTDTETGPQQLYPPRNTWTFEVCYDAEADKWHGCGATYDGSVFENAHETAKDDFRYRAEHDRQRRKFRLVRATTTYTVEAEHQPPAAPAEQPAAADNGEGVGA